MGVIEHPAVDDGLWSTIASHSDSVDREARFPAEAVAGLADAGLLALGVPAELGGPGGGPAEVVAAVERVASACSSTAMVYVMHAIAAQTLIAGAGDRGANRDVLREIATGRHLPTLAFSEPATRSHFWAQASRAEPDGDAVIVSAHKSWVTSAGHADSYVTATGAHGAADPLVTELYLIPAGTPGIEVGGPFDGLGLCGNASSAIEFASVRVDAARRLGAPASGMSLMMEATLPWFVLGCAACCVGLGAAVAMAADHLAGTRLEHLQTPLSGVAVNRARLAEAKIRHMQARALLYEVAGQVAAGDPAAQLGVQALKAAAAEMAIAVTDETMRVCGGAAFSRHLPLERLFRDARAATVMAPTSDVLRDLMGRALTGQPLF